VIIEKNFNLVSPLAGKLKKVEIDVKLEGLPCQFQSIAYRYIPNERCVVRANNSYIRFKRAFSVLKNHIYGKWYRSWK